MIRRYVFLFLLALPAFVVGCSNYSQMSKDLEEYRPPVYTVPRAAEGKRVPGLQVRAGLLWKREKSTKAKSALGEGFEGATQR